MQCAKASHEIPRIVTFNNKKKQVIYRRVKVRKSILQHLIPYLQVLGFIVFVCLANGIVENL